MVYSSLPDVRGKSDKPPIILKVGGNRAALCLTVETGTMATIRVESCDRDSVVKTPNYCER